MKQHLLGLALIVFAALSSAGVAYAKNDALEIEKLNFYLMLGYSMPEKKIIYEKNNKDMLFPFPAYYIKNSDIVIDFLEETAEYAKDSYFEIKRRIAIRSAQKISNVQLANFIYKMIVLRRKGKISEKEMIIAAFPNQDVNDCIITQYQDKYLVAAWLRVKEEVKEDLSIKEIIDYVISGGVAKEESN